MGLKITFLFSLFCGVLLAGESGPTLTELQNKYKDEHAVFLSEKEHIHIKTKGNTFEIYNDVSWEMLYLSDKAKAYANQTVQFSDFSEITNLKAYSCISLFLNSFPLTQSYQNGLIQI